MNSKDINWSKYYEAIKDECPWSSFAYTQGKLLHLDFKSYKHTTTQEEMTEQMNLWAIAYINPDKTPDELNDWCEQRNKEQETCTYFFSHPEHDPNGNATPIPMLIQQNRYVLELARDKVFDKGMDNQCNPDYMIDRYEQTGEITAGGFGHSSLTKRYKSPYGRGKARAKTIKRINGNTND
jgi:hypothetical protein